MITPRHVITRALLYVGAPYLWTAKGLMQWDAVKGLKSHGLGVPCFDCSGLVTVALQECGGPDWRATHNAAALFKKLDLAPNADEFGVLRFYGANPLNPTHVEFALGNGLVLGAAGGDSSTTSLEIARRQNARVRVGFDTRRDLVGARYLPLTTPAARS